MVKKIIKFFKKEKSKNFKYVEGDLIQLALEGEFDVIAHGCNCRNIMEAGIAKQIKTIFPDSFEADKQWFRDKRNNNGVNYLHKLGDFSVGLGYDKLGYLILVFNLYTQINPGRNFDYAAFEMSLEEMVKVLSTNKTTLDYKIGLPMIGCGIGGGKWSKVEKIIKKTLKDFDVTVVKYKENEI